MPKIDRSSLFVNNCHINKKFAQNSCISMDKSILNGQVQIFEFMYIARLDIIRWTIHIFHKSYDWTWEQKTYIITVKWQRYQIIAPQKKKVSYFSSFKMTLSVRVLHRFVLRSLRNILYYSIKCSTIKDRGNERETYFNDIICDCEIKYPLKRPFGKVFEENWNKKY